MTSLSSILVRDRAVPVRTIEEALQRQAVSGGDLETALLEIDALPENTLAAYRAATLGLLPATREEVMNAAPEVRALLPAALAAQVPLVPLRAEGRVLVVAAADALSPEEDAAVGRALGRDLVYRVVTPPRLALARAAHFGLPIDRRLVRLGERLAQRDAGTATFVVPPPAALKTRRGAAGAPGTPADPDATLVDAPAPALPAAAAPVHAPPAAAAPAPVHAAPRLPTGTILRAHLDDALGPPRPTPRHAPPPTRPSARPAPPPPPSSAPPPSLEPPAALDVPPPPRVPGSPVDALRRRRGPLGYEEAVDALAVARHRDEVLEVLFAFARQFFEHTALFVVADGALVGRDAWGPGAPPEALRALRVPLGPAGGALAAALESGAPGTVDLARTDEDRRVAAALGRLDAQPCALLPAVVRRRAVVLLYGDQAGDRVLLGDLSRLLAFLPRVSEAFERLILERKLRRRDGGDDGPSEPLGVADTQPAPPPRMSSPRPPPLRSSPTDVLGLDRTPSPAPPAFVDHVEVAAARPAAPASGRPHSWRPAPQPAPPARTGATRRLPAVPRPDEPSVIVDMGEPIEALVRSLVTFGPDDEREAVEALLRVGEAALPVLVKHFPGPLWFDRRQPHRKLPRGHDVSAIARALTAFGERAVPYLATLVGDPRPDVRFYAVMVAADLGDPRLLAPLVARLLDEDAGVRRLAHEVLGPFQASPEELGRALHPVRSEARVPRRGEGAERRLWAVEALGALRDRRSLDLLVELLEAPDDALRAAAREALVALTRQDFGDSPRRWLSWAEKQEGRHRLEWLIDALLHPDEVHRQAAAEELQQLTQQYHGYHASLPKRDREIAHRRYLTWWETEGRARWLSPQ